MRVLIVDDESELRELIVEYLLEESLFDSNQVRTAADGEEGFAIFQEFQPQLIVTDILMPRMTGPEMIEKIREWSSEPEIIVMTGHDDIDTVVSLFKYRVFEFIRKPFNYEELTQVVKRCKKNFDLQQENELYKKQLIEAEKMSSIGLLAAGVAHEINNPNTFVKGNFELLIRLWPTIQKLINDCRVTSPNGDQGPDSQVLFLSENFEKICKAGINGADRISRIVSSLLNLSRSGSHTQEVVNIANALTESIELTRFKAKNVRLEVQFPEERTSAQGNKQDLVQVFMNLIINAVDALESVPNEGAHLKIWVEFDPMRNAQRIWFEDNGHGIPENLRERVFEPFFTTKEVSAGTGLGLSIAKSHIEKWGGRIGHQPSKNGGTGFWIELPDASERKEVYVDTHRR